MLTIFSSPKPFSDPFISMIQKNAIQSWCALKPKCKVILFGNEPGISDVAAEYRIQHISDVEYKNGKPLLKALFRTAESLSDSDVLVYINADIILLSNFTSSIEQVQKKIAGSPFLIVGQRCNLEVKKPIDFTSQSWEPVLHRQMVEQGRMGGVGSIDYFVFTKGLWPDIPPLTIGRVAFDNWLIFEARRLGIKVIDATPSINIVHQHHVLSVTNESSPTVLDRDAFSKWLWERRMSPEALEQIRLAGGNKSIFTIDNANWVLEQHKLVKRSILIRIASYLKKRYDYISALACHSRFVL